MMNSCVTKMLVARPLSRGRMPCAKESDDERDDDDLDVEASGKRKAAARHSADAKKRKLTPDDFLLFYQNFLLIF